MSSTSQVTKRACDARHGRRPKVGQIIDAVKKIPGEFRKLPSKSGRGRKVSITPIQACIVKAVCEVLGLGLCRDLGSPLEEHPGLVAAIGLDGVPSWITIYKAVGRASVEDVRLVARALAELLPGTRRKAAIADGTGFSQEPHKRYNKHGKKKKDGSRKAAAKSETPRNKKMPRGFTNCVIVEDFETHLVLDFNVGTSKVGELTLFAAIVLGWMAWIAFAAFLGDLGYDCCWVHAWVRDNFRVCGVPVRWNASARARGEPGRHLTVRTIRSLGDEAWREKYGSSPASPAALSKAQRKEHHRLGLAAWKKLVGFGRRTSVERAISAIKARFGGFTRSRGDDRRLVEVSCKVLAHDLLLLALYPERFRPAAIPWF